MDLNEELIYLILKLNMESVARMTDKPASSLDEQWTARDGPIARRVTAVVIGAGNRGENYASFALDFPSRNG